jgi:hypothetical protein
MSDDRHLGRILLGWRCAYFFFDAGWQKVSDHKSVSALPQKSIREAWRLPDPKSEIGDSEIKWA